MAATDISKITEKSKWQDITLGNQVYGAGTSKAFKTGEWRTQTPVFDSEKCKQCLLCVPVCPDSSIPVCDSKRGEFDLDHCKGCGICAKVCPFDAISMKEGQ
ncbi:MAG: 4Fe-4S binding protein [Lachnospiraceae bacterium]|nr:4Fe-4S binding protein [Lachnospiraceae bacterium]